MSANSETHRFEPCSDTLLTLGASLAAADLAQLYPPLGDSAVSIGLVTDLCF